MCVCVWGGSSTFLSPIGGGGVEKNYRVGLGLIKILEAHMKKYQSPA